MYQFCIQQTRTNFVKEISLFVLLLISSVIEESQAGGGAPAPADVALREVGQYVCANGECLDMSHSNLNSFYYTTKKECMELSTCGPNKWYCPNDTATDCLPCNSTNPCPSDRKLYPTPDHCQIQAKCHPECGSHQRWTRYHHCAPSSCDAYGSSNCDYGHSRADITPGCICDAWKRYVMHNSKCILVDECSEGSSIRYSVRMKEGIQYYCGDAPNTCSYCNVSGIACPSGVTLYNSSFLCHNNSECKITCGKNMHWSTNFHCESTVPCDKYYIEEGEDTPDKCRQDEESENHGCACDRGFFYQQGTCVRLEECGNQKKFDPDSRAHTPVMYSDKSPLGNEKLKNNTNRCKDTNPKCAELNDRERCQVHLESCMKSCGCCLEGQSEDKLKKCESKTDAKNCLTGYNSMLAEKCGPTCCRWMFEQFRQHHDSLSASTSENLFIESSNGFGDEPPPPPPDFVGGVDNAESLAPAPAPAPEPVVDDQE